MIFVNFKIYKESSGPEALRLVSVIDNISRHTGVPVIPVVQAVNLKEVSAISARFWVQSIDPVTYGAFTGATLAEEVVRLGASGVFLNHSEKKIADFDVLKLSIERAREVGLSVLVFAADMAELALVLKLKPDYVSYEPPELIGSTTNSVATSKADVISEASLLCADAKIPLIVGAGIHDYKDVKVSLELGAYGIAVASGVIKAEDPQLALEELASAFVQNKKKK